MIGKRLLYLFLGLILSYGCRAEELQIKSFSVTMEPMTVPMQRVDKNGEVCALVKVIVPSAQAAFEGNLIGQSEYKTAEYWCYLTPGSKFLKIKYPECEPLMVNFEELLGAGVQGKRIYELVLTVPEKIHNKDIFTFSGRITADHLEGMDAYERKDYFDKIIGSTNVYLNYRNGKYDKVITQKELMADRGKYPNESFAATFNMPGVKFGDSISVVSGNSDYNSITKIVTPNSLGKGENNFELKRKYVVGTYRIVDGDTKEPLEGIRIYDGKNKEYSAVTHSDTLGHLPIAVTDSMGRFSLEILKGAKRKYIFGKKEGYRPTDVRETKDSKETFYVYRNVRYLDLDAKDIANKDEITIIVPDKEKGKYIKTEYWTGSERFCIKIPIGLEPEYVIIRRPGYKSAKVDITSFSGQYYSLLKMKKGDENETVEYRRENKKWKEVK